MATGTTRKLRISLFARSVVLGCLVGILATAFRFLLETAESFRQMLHQHLQNWGIWGSLATTLCLGLGVGASVALVRWFCPEASGSGIPHVKAVLRLLIPFRAVRVILVKFFSTVLGIGSGLALGREGPTIQMGAAVGELTTRLWPANLPDFRAAMIIGGAAAGLSAAFNAPLAGVTFALEELQVFTNHSAFLSALVASMVADTISRLCLGDLPVFDVVLEKHPGLSGLPHCFAIGLAMGILGGLFHRSLIASTQWFDRAPRWCWFLLFVAITLSLAGLLVWDPMVLGGGLGLTEVLLKQPLPLATLLGYLALRWFLSVGSFALGGSGGIFAPMLLLGGLAGMSLGHLAHRWGIPHSPEPLIWCLVSMAGFFAAVVRCPLTSIVLMVEMTGIYELALPLMCGSFTAAFVAELQGIEPVYDVLSRWRYPDPRPQGQDKP